MTNELDALLDQLAERVVSRLAPRIVAIEDELRKLHDRIPARLVDVREAADTLGVSVATVRRMVKSGELASRRVGRSVRVDLATVRASNAIDYEILAHMARSEPSLRLVRGKRRD